MFVLEDQIATITYSPVNIGLLLIGAYGEQEKGAKSREVLQMGWGYVPDATPSRGNQQYSQAPVGRSRPTGGQGLSTGGLMETRIGAVGKSAGSLPTVPEASAYMY